DGIRDFHVTGVQTCALPISVGPIGAPESSRGWISAVVAVLCAAAPALAQEVVEPASTQPDETDVVVLSPFEVSTTTDEGYAAERSEERRVGKERGRGAGGGT